MIITFSNNRPYDMYTETQCHVTCFMIKSKQKITKFQEHLIIGVTSSGIDALSTHPSHAVHKSLKESLWYFPVTLPQT